MVRVIWLFLLLVSTSAKTFDYFVFAQHWPAGFCLTEPGREKCQVPPSDKLWNVHGLWPNCLSGHHPFFCGGKKFDEKAVSPIRDELAHAWPNLLSTKPVDSLWKHEWEKHGTCAAQLPSLDTELKYFSAGLSLYRKFDIAGLLASADVKPSNELAYKTSVLQNALRTKLGEAKFLLVCAQKDGKNYLVQLEICLDKGLRLMDCPPAASTYGVLGLSQENVGNEVPGSCPQDASIWYIEPHSLEIDFRSRSRKRSDDGVNGEISGKSEISRSKISLSLVDDPNGDFLPILWISGFLAFCFVLFILFLVRSNSQRGKQLEGSNNDNFSTTSRYNERFGILSNGRN